MNTTRQSPWSPHRRHVFGPTGPEHPVDGTGHCRAFASLSRAKVRASDDGTIGFAGHAAVFDQRTLIGGKRWGFFEELAPGAFKNSLADGDFRFLHDHQTGLVLARTKSGTLRLTEDDIGLAVDADLAPTTTGRDLAVLLERGDIDQMSFAFEPIVWERSEDEDGVPVYRLTEVRLYEVSTVAFPAYEGTDAGLRGDPELVVERTEVGGLGSSADLLERIERSLSCLTETMARNQVEPPAAAADLSMKHDELRHRMLTPL
jgi:HK97 family phage prohead protease